MFSQIAIQPHPSGPVSRAFLADVFSRLVAWLLPVTYFLVTVSFYLRTYDSAQIKLTLTQVGCGTVMLFWLLQLLFEKRWPFTRQDLPIVAPFLAILASGIVSFAQSSFPLGSLDEFTRRVFYVFMALIVIAEFRGMDRQRRLLRWLVAAFAVTVFYGFVQYFDNRLFPPGIRGVFLDPFIWRQAFSQRVFSSFGNPNFYGNFLVIITPILIALYLKSGGRVFRPFLSIAPLTLVVLLTDKLFLNNFGGITVSNQTWVSAGLLLAVLGVFGLIWWKSASAGASGMLLFFMATFVNLYATETKGAWVGFIGAIVASAVLVGFFIIGPRARRKALILLASAGFVALAGIAVVRHYSIKRKQSVDFRVFTWIATWDMIRTQPFFGTGIGSFKWAYPAFRRPEIILLEGRSNTETDHAEDEYLEIMFDEGLVGFGIFLWLVLAVSWLGLKTLARLTHDGPRPPPALAFEPRVYSILAFLGAWWAALIHWFMDVSIRFVSSGIYSFLLPALVVCFVRNDPMPDQQDKPSRVEPWVRLAAVGFFMAFFLWAQMEASLVFFVGACLIAMGELLELRLAGGPRALSPTPFLVAGCLAAVAETADIGGLSRGEKPLLHLLRILAALGLFLVGWIIRKGEKRQAESLCLSEGPPVAWFHYPAAAVLVGLWLAGLFVWRGYFLADVSHNVAIFFSKQRIWMKSPEFDEQVNSQGFPPNMKDEYEKVGGALEHYEKTARLNPAFPMANYFVGNVHNDWGTGFFDRAREARARGDASAAETFRAQAEEQWRQSLDTYAKVKAFAPNYVQTHHQVGLLYVKLAEMEKTWGREDKANEYWDKALTQFKLYQNLDPVFPANYYRQAYVHFMREDFEKAEEAYLGALVHNSTNVVGRVYEDRNSETYSGLARTYYVRLVNRHPQGNIPADSPLFKKAEEYYLKALASAARSHNEEEVALEPAKSLAVLYGRAGLLQKSQDLWLKIRQWNPRDPDVQKVFSPPAPG